MNNQSIEIKILKYEPQILIYPQNKIALLWSAKAGCTFAVKWFFLQANLLDAALFYTPWIHQYRDDVFYHSQTYLNALPEFLADNYIIFKFVRSPYPRVVSSYIHALKHGYENLNMKKFLNREISPVEGFSFEEFVHYLMSIDITNCNIHHKQQLHALEYTNLVTPTHIIKLEDPLNKISQLEERYNLKRTNLEELKSSPHHINYQSEDDFYGSIRYSSQTKEFYTFENFFNEDLRKKVVSIYQRDFEAYNYDHALPKKGM